MQLHELRPAPGSRRPARRVGRGIGSGRGKTCGRGTKGQGARSGGMKGPAFEGGQTPLFRRLPKRGFNNPFRKRYAIVKVGALNRFPAGSVVTPEELAATGLVKKRCDGIKILSDGELAHALTVRAHAFSKGAAAKIAAAGGKVEVIGA
ncbi:MAG TPA: 50S ribosomal protein L15 [Limnochordia bacterium]